MIAALLSRALRILPARVIDGADGSPYLTKYTVANFGKDRWRVHLHHFHRGDEDAELHNHPWRGVSIVLRGGYREYRLSSTGAVEARDLPPGTVNMIAPDTFHRVELLGDEAWTLFFSGPVVQSWGFYDVVRAVYTPWREFIQRKQDRADAA